MYCSWQGIYKILPKARLEPLFKALHTPSAAITHIGLQTLLNVVAQAGAGNEQNEIAAKTRFFEQQGMTAVVETLVRHSKDGDPVAVQATNAALHIALSVLVSRIHTSDMDMVHQTLSLLKPHCETILNLTALHQPANIRNDATMLFRAMLLEADVSAAVVLQDTARNIGALLWHFAYAIADCSSEESSPKGSPKNTTAVSSEPSANVDDDEVDPPYPAIVVSKEQRTLSRQIVELLCDDNQTSRNALNRMIPGPLANQLSITKTQQPASLPMARIEGKKQKQLAEKQNKHKQTKGNWSLLWQAIDMDHETEVLIWNAQTRAELRSAVASEVADVLVKQYWDWQSFDVEHSSIANELRAGPFYLRLLLPKLPLFDVCCVLESF